MSDPRAENCRAYSQDSAGLVTGIELTVREHPESKYRLHKALLIPEAQAAGQHVATCSAVGADGIPTGDPVFLAWGGFSGTGQGRDIPFDEVAPSGSSNNVHVVANPFDPSLKFGPLCVKMGAGKTTTDSDILGGIGLPGGHHVCFVAIFVLRGAISTDPPDPELSARLAAIEAELIKQAKAELIDDATDIEQSARIASLITSNKIRADSIAALGLRMTAIETKAVALSGSLNTTITRANAEAGKVTALNSGYLALTAAVDILKSRNDTTDKNVGGLASAVDIIQARVTALESGQGGGTAGFPPHRFGTLIIGNREADLLYIVALNPAAVKIVNPDPEIVRRVLATVGPACVVVLRDHPMSEQKEDMKRDPVACGKRHAEDWIAKLTVGRFKEFGSDKRIAVVGINEPDVHNAAEEQIVFLYTKTFLEILTRAGIRALALNLSVGWPRNAGPGLPPIWDTFLPLEPIILDGGHWLCTHEYFYPAVKSNWGWHANRIDKCPMNVPVIIGEVGFSRQVAGLDRPYGWIGQISAVAYAEMLWEYHDSVSKSVYAIMPFTSGYASADIADKDILPAVTEILPRKRNYTWPAVWPVQKGASPLPPLPPGDGIIWPKMPRITQWYGPGHSGLDVAIPTGTPLYAMADGVVGYSGVDDPNVGNGGYGEYVRIYYEAYAFDSFFGHMSRRDVVTGQAVKRGHHVGLSGNTGNSTGSHLHLELRIDNEDSIIARAGVGPFSRGQVDPMGVRWALEKIVGVEER